MNLKKLAPWNWFSREEELDGQAVPVNKAVSNRTNRSDMKMLTSLFDDFDRLFDYSSNRFGPSLTSRLNRIEGFSGHLLKPKLDLGSTRKEYSIQVEIPGVDEKDIRLEIDNDTLTISGEKKQASEEKNRQYYRLERSYGSFQRMLSLPRDADRENINARFKKGVLTVTIPRKSIPESQVKQIQIKHAS
jgi:HSP20 family protein